MSLFCLFLISIMLDANKLMAQYENVQRSCLGCVQIFLKYNNYKNHIINKKSDKSKILNLRMTARHCQLRLYRNASLSVMRLSRTNTNRTSIYLCVYL
jgi:hypothetical protein